MSQRAAEADPSRQVRGPRGAGRAARLLRLNFGPAALPLALAASGAHRFNVGLASELFCEAPSLE